MKLLAVDSGGAQAGFAAIEGDACTRSCEADGSVQLRGVAWLEDGRELSRLVVLCLDRALAAAGWTQDDIDAVALAAGPGSWTGLRIGFSACKTLAQVRGLPLITVPTYDAVAGAVWRRDRPHQPTSSDTAILAVAGHCRAGHAYLKLFEGQTSKPLALGAERIVPMAEMANLVRAAAAHDGTASSIFVAGPAAETACALLNEKNVSVTWLKPERDAALVELGRLALAALEDGSQSGDPLAAQPLYLAPSAAERALQEARAQPR